MIQEVNEPIENSDDAILRKEDNDLFIQNFQLIYDNAELIIRTPDYFLCECKTAYLSTFYIGRGGKISLGSLLLLWQEGKLKEKCPSCGGDVFVFGESGSPLSGAYSWWGFCPECAAERYGKGDAFHWQPVYEQIEEHTSWPPRVSVSFKDLIEALKSK